MKFSTAILIGFSLATLGGSGGNAQGLDSSRKLIQEEQFDQALQLLDKIKQLDPSRPGPYLYSAECLLETGRIRDAEIEANRALELGVQQVDEVLKLTDLLGRLEQNTLALELLQKLKGQLPQSGLWRLADLHYQRQEPQEALLVLKGYPASPEDLRLKVRLGALYLMAKDYPRAIVEFRAALSLEPDHRKANFGLAQALWLNFQSEEAQEAFLKAAELDPDNPNAWHLLGIVCMEMKQPEKAVAYLERGSRLPDTFAKILFDLGNAYRQAGQEDLARQTLQKYQQQHNREEAERNRKQRVIQLHNQATQEMERGAVAKARQSWLRVLQEDADHWETNLNLAKIYLSSGYSAAALGHLQRLSQQPIESAEAKYLMAFYWSEQGRPEEALSYAEESRRLRPGHADLRNLLGNLYFGLDRREEALEEYQAAVKLAPHRADFRTNYEYLARKKTP